MEIVISIVFIAIVIALIVLIRKIFLNFMLSRIASAILAVIGLIMGFGLAELAPRNVGEMDTTFWIAIIVNIFAWMFYIGPIVFDVEWDGTFTLTLSGDHGTLSPNMTGGFLGNLFISAIMIAGSFFIFGLGGMTFVFWLVPVAIIVLDAISVLRAFF